MNLDSFTQQVSRQGLAKNTNWVCNVFVPPGMGGQAGAMADATRNDRGRLTVNLPGLDIINNAIGTIDNAINSLNNLEANIGGITINNNLNVPTLGFSLANTAIGMQALSMYCHSCSIPARDIINSEWSEYGEMRNLGVKHSHGDLAIGYYCSEDLRERNFFEQWQNLIFNPANKRHSYYKDYISRIEIDKYSAGWNRRTARYAFYEAYPTNVGETSLMYEGTDVVKLDITFKYRYFERIA